MPGLYDLVSRYASPYYNLISTVFIVLLFVIAGYYGYKYYTDSIRDNGNGCIFFTSKQGYTEGMTVKLCGYNSIIEHGKRTNTK